MSSPQSFITVPERGRVETRVRGSRFIATVLPVSSRDEATDEIARLQKEFWDATHNCYAWRLAPDGLRYRFADDGEPSGSAGKPILFVLQQRELVDLLVVVTRYFGGTKLGVGGLVRAYSDATTAALDAVGTVERHPSEQFRVLVPYEDIKAIRPLVESFAITFTEEYNDVVSYLVELRSDHVESFSAQLVDLSQGRGGIVPVATD